MREILFRGKRIDNGEWVYGYYCPVVRGKFPATPCIVPDCDEMWEGIPIIPETVGQYTGLKDKNGNKIFEGDIIKSTDKYNHSVMYIVEFLNGAFCLRQLEVDYKITFWDVPDKYFINEVVGNIHDNPELLEVQNEK